VTTSPEPPARPLFLGIEGGASHTVALMADVSGRLIKRVEAGPANLRLLSDAQLLKLLKSIAASFPKPDSLAIGLAGVRAKTDGERIQLAAAKIWPAVPCYATDDLEIALAAPAKWGAHAPSRAPNRRPRRLALPARVLILSGTGSCCYGRSAAGKITKVGGWGQMLGDEGSGYAIGLGALKAVVFQFDREGVMSRLGQRLLHRLQLNEPNEIIAWMQDAEKFQVAALAPEVFHAWKKGDKIAAKILAEAQESLVEAGLACARKLAKPKSPVQFVLAGSILLKEPQFGKAVAQGLKQAWPNAVVSPLEREGAWGAVALARELMPVAVLDCTIASGSNVRALPPHRCPPHEPDILDPHLTPAFSPPLERERRGRREDASVAQSAKIVSPLSPTEQRNPRSRNLDKMPVTKAIDLMLSEDAKIPAAIRVERVKIERAVGFIARAFQRGGRLIYVGAGTSGRLGVLDASECPPTFRSGPEMVQGIIAGGQSALWRSVEGAEDDPNAGARAIEFRNISRHDVVVGIAASGRTPFVWGALAEARKRGAKTILLAFNPYLEIPGGARPTLVITPNLGPEILTGSTRLKSGTATKLILNIFTTLTMVRLGKVVSNLMVDLNPSNVKLRDRAVRIVQQLRGVDYATAEKALK